MFDAGGGDQQLEAQLGFGVPDDRPGLGIGHGHGDGGGAEGLFLLHPAQQLRNAGTEAFVLPKDPHGQYRSEFLFHKKSIAQNPFSRQYFYWKPP